MTAHLVALAATAASAMSLPTPIAALEVTAFWRSAGPSLWFAKDAAFDRRFAGRFMALHQDAAAGRLDSWTLTPEGSLALVILLDQFPRNAFRGTPRMYVTDPAARRIADRAIAAGHDRAVDNELAKFFYLPFGHSEVLADQERSLQLSRRLGGIELTHAARHHDIIKRFGRFPHRNPILGRTMRPEEQAYLDGGGFGG